MLLRASHILKSFCNCGILVRGLCNASVPDTNLKGGFLLSSICSAACAPLTGLPAAIASYCAFGFKGSGFVTGQLFMCKLYSTGGPLCTKRPRLQYRNVNVNRCQF